MWELWRRLPPDDVAVLTTPYRGDTEWDATQAFRVVRTQEKVLLPTPGLARRIDALADEVEADLVLLDPALPLGLLGPRLRHRYGLVLHGAEVTVPGRLLAPTSRCAMCCAARSWSSAPAAIRSRKQNGRPRDHCLP